MKILYLQDHDEILGEAEMMMFRLRDGMRRLGHDARLFASSAGIFHESSGNAEYQCFGTKSRFRGLNQAANPRAALSLRRVLAEFRPDVVHVGMFLTQLSPLILPVLRKVPSIYYAMSYHTV